MYKEQRCIAILKIHKKKLQDTGLLLASAKDGYCNGARDFSRLHIVRSSASGHLSSSDGFNLIKDKTVSLIKVYQDLLVPFLCTQSTMNNLLLCQKIN